MIETTEQATPVESAPAVSPRGTVLAIGLMSFSALLLELGLTRLFSVVLFYHFAFLAISIALLGLGAGAVFAHLWTGSVDVPLISCSEEEQQQVQKKGLGHEAARLLNRIYEAADGF